MRRSQLLSRLQTRAHARGYAEAVKEQSSKLEARYALAAVGRLWVCVAVVFAIAFSAGAAVGVGWSRSGLDGSPRWERAQ